MDYQEAIEVLNNHERYVGVKYVNGVEEAYVTPYFEKALDTAISAMQELQEYKQIGTLEEVRDAVEKQHHKTPTYEGDGYAPDGSFVWDEWICPRCGTIYEVEYDEHDYCPNCGQHIDWSEEDD